MGKDEKKVAPVAVVVAEPAPQTGCVVCGQYTGTFPGTAGAARWHAECEAARPDVIAKVKARA